MKEENIYYFEDSLPKRLIFTIPVIKKNVYFGYRKLKPNEKVIKRPSFEELNLPDKNKLLDIFNRTIGKNSLCFYLLLKIDSKVLMEKTELIDFFIIEYSNEDIQKAIDILLDNEMIYFDSKYYFLSVLGKHFLHNTSKENKH